MSGVKTDDLLKQAQGGDKTALEKFISQNLGLVHMAARRFLNRGVDYEDLIQIGYIGLIKATERFDFAQNTAFSTYAVPLIFGEIRRYFRDNGLIKISRSIKENGYKVSKAREDLILKLGREPGVMEIAEHCNLDINDVIVALESMVPVVSLSAAQYDDEENSIEDFVGLDETPNIVERITLKEALSTLEPMERQLVTFRYLLNKTQQETAELLTVSQVQISRLEKKIFTKLRAFYNKD